MCVCVCVCAIEERRYSDKKKDEGKNWFLHPPKKKVSLEFSLWFACGINLFFCHFAEMLKAMIEFVAEFQVHWASMLKFKCYAKILRQALDRISETAILFYI